MLKISYTLNFGEGIQTLDRGEIFTSIQKLYVISMY